MQWDRVILGCYVKNDWWEPRCEIDCMPGGSSCRGSVLLVGKEVERWSCYGSREKWMGSDKLSGGLHRIDWMGEGEKGRRLGVAVHGHVSCGDETWEWLWIRCLGRSGVVVWPH